MYNAPIYESYIGLLKASLAEKLVNDVTLLVFTREHDCDYCEQTYELVRKLGSLTEKIRFQVFDLLADKNKADEFRVDKVPAIVIIGSNRSRIKFYGLPAGYEFNTFVKDLVQVSQGHTDLSSETREAAKTIKGGVNIKVFVTSTCPHCAPLVSLTHQLGMENPNIEAEAIQINEFPELARKYNVTVVPKTVINDEIEIIGLQSEGQILSLVKAAAGSAHGSRVSNPEEGSLTTL